MTSGVQTHGVEGRMVKVYEPAKTIADCYKYRNKIGLDTALEALRVRWRARRFTMDELDLYAAICRVQRVMKPYLEALSARPRGRGNWRKSAGQAAAKSTSSCEYCAARTSMRSVANLASPPPSSPNMKTQWRDNFIQNLMTKVGDQMMMHRIASQTSRVIRERPPFSAAEAIAMSAAMSPSAHKLYGIERICTVWNISHATIQRHQYSVLSAPRRILRAVWIMARKPLARSNAAQIIAPTACA